MVAFYLQIYSALVKHIFQYFNFRNTNDHSIPLQLIIQTKKRPRTTAGFNSN